MFTQTLKYTHFSSHSYRRLSSILSTFTSKSSTPSLTVVRTMATTNKVYDLVVLGGGSGGLAAAKHAINVFKQSNPSQPLSVAVFDFVSPTQHGTKWGLGGTCVNVGCIPKKLMHHAATIGHHMSIAPQMGWQVDVKGHDWHTMVEYIGNYIKSLNFSYRTDLRVKGITYIEAEGSFVDANTIEYTLKNKPPQQLSFKQCIVATGGRPTQLAIPGGELAITSDDLFWLKKSPGKTLVVGGGYIAVECASFLRHLGYDVSVMIRGLLLRSFDQQIACMIGELMERDGVKFITQSNPVELRKNGDKIDAIWESNINGVISRHTETFDTVLSAIGRTPNTAKLNVDKAGIKLARNKILVNEFDQSTVPHIFAIGDVAAGVKSFDAPLEQLVRHAIDRPELTPVAIRCGQLLAERMYGNSKELTQYHLIPTAVFTTPSEYGVVGLSEEYARQTLGDENVQIYWSRFGSIEMSPQHPHYVYPRSSAFTHEGQWSRIVAHKQNKPWSDSLFEENSSVIVRAPNGATEPGRVEKRYPNAQGEVVYDVKLENGTLLQQLSHTVLGRESWEDEEQEALFSKANSLVKLVIDRRTDVVIGMHIVAAGAGEMVQGFGVAMHMGAKHSDIRKLIGIHPTMAEEATVLEVTKDSDASFLKKAGCGGGSCG